MFFKFYPNILILSHMQALRCPCESRCQRSPHANQLGKRRVCPARCGASQGGGAGEGQVQNSGMGEEVNSPIQTPGVFNNPF